MKIRFSGNATKKVQWAADLIYMVMKFRVSRKKETSWLRSWLLSQCKTFVPFDTSANKWNISYDSTPCSRDCTRLLATSECCEDVTLEGRQVDWNVPISSVGFPKHSNRNTGRFRNVVSAVMNSASVLRYLVQYSGSSYAVSNRALCGETPFVCPFVSTV